MKFVCCGTQVPKTFYCHFSCWVFNPFIPLQQLYAKLAELLGLHDHMLILNVIVGKIATNLKFYGEVIVIIDFLWFCRDHESLYLFFFIRVRKLSVKHWISCWKWHLGKYHLTFLLKFFSIIRVEASPCSILITLIFLGWQIYDCKASCKVGYYSINNIQS